MTVQPVELEVENHTTGFNIIASNRSIFTEGSALILVSKAERAYFFPVHLVDTLEHSYRSVDYRSPKTVNPDTGLEQQAIRWKTDENKTLVEGKDQDFFKEYRRFLSPRTATKRAIEDEPLSTYYVRPGSVSSIPLSIRKNDATSEWDVMAGPLKDAYQNTLADGTEVSFRWESANSYYVQTARSLNGFAEIKVPVDPSMKICVHAEIQNKTSEIECSDFK